MLRRWTKTLEGGEVMFLGWTLGENKNEGRSVAQRATRPRVSKTLEQNAVMDVSWDSVYFTQWVQSEAVSIRN